MHHARQNCMTEWAFRSGKTYDDPGNEVELDVLVVGPDEREWRVPAFWAGEQSWQVRFAPPVVGTYRYRSICSDESNSDLHGVEGLLVPPNQVAPLAQAMLAIAQNRELGHRLGQNSRRHVETTFDIQRNVAQTEEIYQQCLAKTAG